jgi:hypothetical protein
MYGLSASIFNREEFFHHEKEAAGSTKCQRTYLPDYTASPQKI